MENEYFNKGLVGGNAIITTGLWASKVSKITHDKSSFGTFTVTTIQGKKQKSLSMKSNV
jgi:hypothetical protein